jgi:hypothetical protein
VQEISVKLKSEPAYVNIFPKWLLLVRYTGPLTRFSTRLCLIHGIMYKGQEVNPRNRVRESFIALSSQVRHRRE